MKRRFLILNAALAVFTLVCCVFYDQMGSVLLKGLTCFGFVSIGIANLLYCIRVKSFGLKFPALMALGLSICMAGDVTLDLHFLAGALIFALGHVFYFAAYCCLEKFRLTDLFPALTIFLGSAALILLTPLFDFGSALMKGVCLLYALIISCMLGKATANYYRTQGSVTGLLQLGSILFFFSDLMLCLNIFADAPHITDVLCLYTYFPGQCILAHSLFHYADSR